MKKLIALLIATVALLVVQPVFQDVKAQTTTNTLTALNSTQDFSDFLGVKDTLTNTDTTIYVWKVAGKRHCLTFQCDVLKLSGTVAGKFEIYGSTNGGSTYGTTPVKTVNKTDASLNYQLEMTHNGYTHYKIMSISSGTNTHSQRCSATVRRE